ncbi:hypothetical protein CDAR_562601 [Caerostris darwini]|uniref:Uncharacterized protein n=1 Tax=Caerostris darwini TaxID=1538125 RepID=A0AAV4X5N1_9ARAC|nr:hypothetical protein CDAR_562601 [Caerostris darwini]
MGGGGELAFKASGRIPLEEFNKSIHSNGRNQPNEGNDLVKCTRTSALLKSLLHRSAARLAGGFISADEEVPACGSIADMGNHRRNPSFLAECRKDSPIGEFIALSFHSVLDLCRC